MDYSSPKMWAPPYQDTFYTPMTVEYQQNEK